MGVQELLGKVVEERVDQIIGDRLPGLRARYYEKQEAILDGLDPETRDQFEKLLESLLEGWAEECRAVYEAAFLDGLRLAHRAF